MKISLGSDHRGFEAKERIKAMLSGEHQVTDHGTNAPESCDYSDIGARVARDVSSGGAERGILLCGTGIGMSIVANKLPRVRAALCHDELTAQYARRHNDANVLCLPADLVGEALIARMVELWLETTFEGGRHGRRIDKIAELERGLCEEAG